MWTFPGPDSGGPRQVTWGVDRTQLGQARYYDQFTSQFVWKLAKGSHRFWVKSSCGEETVSFKVA